VASSLGQLRSDIEADVAQVVGQAWQGQAAEAFRSHMEHPANAVGLLEEALNGVSRAANAYADRLQHAQDKYREAMSIVAGAGLRMANDFVIDPSSLLPPDPGKAAAAARAEALIAQAVAEGTEATAALVRDLAGPLVTAERASAEVTESLGEVIKSSIDAFRGAMGSGLLWVESTRRDAVAKLEKGVTKAEEAIEEAGQRLVKAEQEAEELGRDMAAKSRALERDRPLIDKWLGKLGEAVPGAKGLADKLRGLASPFLPGGSKYQAGAAELQRWFTARSEEVTRARQLAATQKAVAEEELARLRPILTDAREAERALKPLGVAGKVLGVALVLPAIGIDYMDFYDYSHDETWSRVYAGENLIGSAIDLAGDALIGISPLVGPEAAVAGVGVTIVGAGVVIGVQAVTRYVYDHRTGFSQNFPAATVQATKDFAQDAKESWDLVPGPEPLKTVAAVAPMSPLAVPLQLAFVGSLLAHSKGWI
jgi:uncharacterized protein YukE